MISRREARRMIEEKTGDKCTHIYEYQVISKSWYTGKEFANTLSVHYMNADGLELGYVTDLSDLDNKPFIFDKPRTWGEEIKQKHVRIDL